MVLWYPNGATPLSPATPFQMRRDLLALADEAQSIADAVTNRITKSVAQQLATSLRGLSAQVGVLL